MKKWENDVHFFLQIPLFKTLELYMLKNIYLNSSCILQKKNYILYEEGEKPDYFYIVKEGQFAVISFKYFYFL